MAKTHVFLCYCRDNKAEVSRLRDELIAVGEKVWWDGDIHPGQEWKLEIRKAMKDAYAVVLCLSKELGARISSGVYPEVRDAIAAYREYAPGSIFLIPVRLSDCEIPLIEIDGTKMLDSLQYIDLFPTKEPGASMKRLAESIKKASHHPLGDSLKLGRLTAGSTEESRGRGIRDHRGISRPDWNDQTSDEQYDRQLYGLGEPEILRKIRSEPFWRIGIRPSEFKKARFQSVEGCREFMASCCVDVHGWFPYPVVGDVLEKTNEWLVGEVERDEDGCVRRERCALSRSGQFVHSRSFDRFPGIGDRIDIFDILDTVTGAFELAGRMADRGFVSSGVAITFQLNRIAGVELNFPPALPGPRGKYWCQEESVLVARPTQIEELQRERRGLALEAALEIYSHFGWTEPPREWLLEEQTRRFGAAANSY